MKKLFLLGLSILIGNLFVSGQGITIGSLKNADSSAILDVVSNSKGLLFPRVSSAARIAISNPSQGLVLFDTTLKQLFLFDKTQWVALNIPTGSNVGDMIYWDGTKWSILPAGTETQPLVFCNGVPHWGECPGSLADVNTTGPSAVAPSTATIGGNVNNSGSTSVSSRGFVYDTLPSPTTLGNRVNVGSGLGSFSATISGLIPNKQYYFRSFAINNAGTTYGNEITATTPFVLTGGGVTDYNGNIYPTVIIGGQEWMAQNLRAAKYANGNVIYSSNFDSLSNLGIGAWAYPNNNPAFNNPYGKLYNWYAAVDSRNVCPTGWHVPSRADFDILFSYLGGSGIAGSALKEAGNSHWQSPNSDATNSSRFTAIAMVNSAGSIGTNAAYWTTIDEQYALIFFLYYDQTSATGSYAYRSERNSIRCLKN